MNRGLLALGAIATLVGFVAIIDPTVLAITGLSLPSVLITGIGLLALIEALRAGYSRYARSADALDLPEPERRQVASVPGTDFDDRLTSVARRVRSGSVRDRNTVRDRLTETATEVLVRYDGNTPEQAHERLRTGSWTEDRAAAAFFAPASEIQLSATERVRLMVNREDTFRRQSRRVVAALADRIDSGGTDER